MFQHKMQDLIEIIDKNKDNITNHDYMHICNLLKEIYNNHHDDIIMRDNDDLFIPFNYRDIKMIKPILNILSIITSIACMILIYIHMHHISILIAARAQ